MATAPLFDWARWNGQSSRTPATSTTGRPPIWERYQAFVTANPHVLEEALHLARERLARGQKRIGAKALWEELRTSIKVKKLGSYALDNDYTALLARDLVRLEPRLDKVIERRERRSRTDKAADETAPLRKDDDMPRKCSIDVTSDATPGCTWYEVHDSGASSPHDRFVARLMTETAMGHDVVIRVEAPTSEAAVAELRAALESIIRKIV